MAKKDRVRGAFMRTCAGCGGRFDKREHGFLRIANKNGETVLDENGNLGGRGAYICRDVNCVAKLKKSGRLSKLLRLPVPAEIYDIAETRTRTFTSGAARIWRYLWTLTRPFPDAKPSF